MPRTRRRSWQLQLPAAAFMSPPNNAPEMLTRFTYLLAVFFAISSGLAAQSGWVKADGEGYALLSAGLLNTDNYYNLNGRQVTTSTYQSYSINAYVEYGLTDKVDLLFNGPLLRRQSFSTTEATYGVGDVRIGAKYGLASGTWPVAISLEADLPLSPKQQFAENDVQLVPGIVDQINLPASDGEFNFRTTLAASRSISANAYATAFAAFNLRTDGLSHQASFGLEAGYKFFNRLYVIGRLNTQTSLGEPTPGLSFVRGEGVTYTAAGLALAFAVNDNWSVNLSGTTFNDLIFSRRNIYSGTAISLGVSRNW